MKTVFYTCIVADRDPCPQVSFVCPQFDYVLFLDKELDPQISTAPWVVRPLLWRHATDPVRTARWHKHNPMECFPEYEYSIWMDANYEPVADISWFPEWFLRGPDIASFRHPSRNTLEEEAEQVISIPVDDPAVVQAQMLRYCEEGFDSKGYKLHETSILLRRHSGQLRRLSELWWGEIERGSRRDQLSFAYCLWRLNMQCISLSPGRTRDPWNKQRLGNPFFRCRHHPIKPWVAL